MQFRYLRDPLFVTSVVIYFVNRLVLKRVWTEGFLHDHLNDILCIPVWVPVMLWTVRRLGLRRHDEPPDAIEVIVPLVVWSWTFEILLPGSELLGRYCTADHRDVLYYAAGAFGAAVFWRCWYGNSPADISHDSDPSEIAPYCLAVNAASRPVRPATSCSTTSGFGTGSRT